MLAAAALGKYVLETEQINIPSLPPQLPSSAFRATAPVPDVFLNGKIMKCEQSLNCMAKLNGLISKKNFCITI